MKTYTPRRASATRWLQEAPPYILDVLDNGGPDKKNGTCDRYTVLFTFPLAFAREKNSARWLPPGERGSYAETFIPYLGMSGAPSHPQGFSQWGELSAHEAAMYRYRCKHHRVRWLDLPEHIRQHVIARATAE